jgi:hypothetical protein
MPRIEMLDPAHTEQAELLRAAAFRIARTFPTVGPMSVAEAEAA